MCWDNFWDFFRESVTIDIAAIISAIFSFVCWRRTKKIEKEIQSSAQEHDNKIHCLTQLCESIPMLLAEQLDKQNAIINYMNVMDDVLQGTYNSHKFNESSNVLLACISDQDDKDGSIRSRIEEATRDINDYFRQGNRSSGYNNVSFFDSTKSNYDKIKSKLVELLKTHKTTEELYEKNFKFSYSLVANGCEGVEKADISEKQVKDLRDKVKNRKKKQKPPRKRRG